MDDDETQILMIAGLMEDMARKRLVEDGDDSLMPMFHIVMVDGEDQILATPWRNDQEKHIAQQMVRERLKDPRARAYGFISEAWMARYETHEMSKGDPPEIMPRDRLDRIEVVIISVSTRAKRYMKALRMLRGGVKQNDGKVIALEQCDEIKSWDDEGQLRGGMASLFDL